MAFKNLAKLVKQATKVEKSPAEIFGEMLDRSIILHERANTRIPSQTFKPSSLGGCERRIFYEVTGADMDEYQSVEPNFVGICENGTDRHERIQEHVIRMKEYGIDCEWVDVEQYLKLYPVEGTEVVERKGYEVKLRNTKYNLSFMCDGVIKMDGKYYILEIKTEASFKFNKREAVDPKHESQATSYTLAIGIPDVIFVYEDRDFLKKKYYHFQVTKEQQQERVLDKIDRVNTHIEKGTVPPKTTVKSDCSYCNYIQLCKKQGDAL